MSSIDTDIATGLINVITNLPPDLTRIITEYYTPVRPVKKSESDKCGFCHYKFLLRPNRKKTEKKYLDAILLHETKRERHMMCIWCFESVYKQQNRHNKYYFSYMGICILCSSHHKRISPNDILAGQSIKINLI
jgi:hypothetical protein